MCDKNSCSSCRLLVPDPGDVTANTDIDIDNMKDACRNTAASMQCELSRISYDRTPLREEGRQFDSLPQTRESR